jgi:nucleoid-associated protein YgaU
MPMVESFEEQEYVCKAGDSWAAISKGHYLTEQYAEALRQYNLRDALIDDAEKLASGPIRAGQVLYLPSQKLLEKRYGHLIPGLKGDRPTAQPEVRKPVTPVKPVEYRVRAGGQTMWEIARLTLGSGDRWAEIYRLNSHLNSEQPIPAGTTLRLPGDAKLPPE